MIRLGRAADHVGIVRVLCDFAADAPPDFPVIAPARVAADAAAVLACGVVLVAEEAGRIVGALGLMRDRWRWSEEQFIGDTWFTVARDGRRSGAADALIPAAVSVARAAGLPLYLGIMSGRRAPAVMRLYRRHGGQLMGGTFRWG